MKVLNKIGSKKDNAYKYIFLLDNNLIVEATFIDKGDGKFTVYEPSVDNNTAGTQSYALLTSCQYQMSKNSLFLWTESGSLGGVSTFDLDSTHKVIRVGYKDSTDAIIPYSYYPIPYPIQSGDNVLIPVTRTLFSKQIVK